MLELARCSHLFEIIVDTKTLASYDTNKLLDLLATVKLSIKTYEQLAQQLGRGCIEDVCMHSELVEAALEQQGLHHSPGRSQHIQSGEHYTQAQHVATDAAFDTSVWSTAMKNMLSSSRWLPIELCRQGAKCPQSDTADPYGYASIAVRAIYEYIDITLSDNTRCR